MKRRIPPTAGKQENGQEQIYKADFHFTKIMKKVIFTVGMKKLLFPVIVLSLTAFTAAAQEEQKPWLVRTVTNLLNSLTAPGKKYDSTYVYQSPFKWMVGLEGEVLRVGSSLHSNLTVTDLRGETPSTRNGTMDIGLRNDPYQKLGLAVGYGGLSLGYGLHLGNKNDKRNSVFSLGTTSSFWGARVRYTKFYQYPEGKLVLGNDVLDLNSNYKGQMRNLSLDGTYAFNRKRFVYSAAYGGRVLQRRSAGSWLITAKYAQGDFALDPEDGLSARLNNLNRYSFLDFSAGGGYSFNWVLFHRDPSPSSNAAGLRNLTFNATAMGRLSLLNNVYTTQGAGGKTEKVRYMGQLAISPVLMSGMSYTFGRWSILASVEYNRLGFHGGETEVFSERDFLRSNVRTQGVFFDFTAQGKVRVRF